MGLCVRHKPESVDQYIILSSYVRMQQNENCNVAWQTEHAKYAMRRYVSKASHSTVLSQQTKEYNLRTEKHSKVPKMNICVCVGCKEDAIVVLMTGKYKMQQAN